MRTNYTRLPPICSRRCPHCGKKLDTYVLEWTAALYDVLSASVRDPFVVDLRRIQRVIRRLRMTSIGRTTKRGMKP